VNTVPADASKGKVILGSLKRCSKCPLFFSYIQYSNIAAKVVRKSLKPQLQAEAEKRGVVNVKFTKWEGGKAVGKF
jgi:F-type H+-transporting ATPase subunit epsilon